MPSKTCTSDFFSARSFERILIAIVTVPTSIFLGTSRAPGYFSRNPSMLYQEYSFLM